MRENYREDERKISRKKNEENTKKGRDILHKYKYCMEIRKS